MTSYGKDGTVALLGHIQGGKSPRVRINIPKLKLKSKKGGLMWAEGRGGTVNDTFYSGNCAYRSGLLALLHLVPSKSFL